MHKATERPPLIVIYMTENNLGYDEAYSLKTPLLGGAIWARGVSFSYFGKFDAPVSSVYIFPSL